ncbi:MAG: gamma-glutamyltransferase, partial [Hyphomicrobium sp.]
VFFDGAKVQVEEGVPAAVRAQLTGIGHDVSVRLEPWGGAQAIVIDQARGVLIGGSDGRKDGAALGY